jgi:sugar phosphate isomerase/epimerase
VSDTVSVSAGRHNLHAAVDLALEFGLGVELMHFASPDVLDASPQTVVADAKQAVAGVTGPLSLHGPFFDMAPGSIDERVNDLVRLRYTQALHIAAELGAHRMVVHANFLASIRNDFYRRGWHARNVVFWSNFADIARAYDVVILIENMWEYDPSIIADVLREVGHPNLAACLDVGHAHIFSDSGVSLDDWIGTLRPWLLHAHLNNNNGELDEHFGFDWRNGVLRYSEILPSLRELTRPPWMILEMDHVTDMRASLPYFQLTPVQSAGASRANPESRR